VLLIAAAVPDDGMLRELQSLSRDLGVDALVEVHDEPELDRALAAEASVIGINARDLTTFGEDLAIGEGLAKRIPADCVAVAESAIRGVDDARRMADAGFDAVLVGEALVRAPDPEALVRGLADVPCPSR
jgi:indole-3-glycerol phosphate synthase